MRLTRPGAWARTDGDAWKTPSNVSTTTGAGDVMALISIEAALRHGIRTHTINRTMPRALEGLNVVEYNTTGAASYAAKLMADLGADVIKVEDPKGDPDRKLGPFPSRVADPQKSGTFLYLNCNKQGVTLDLRQQQGRALFDKLLGGADVLVHDVPPAQCGELGLTYDRIGPGNRGS